MQVVEEEEILEEVERRLQAIRYRFEGTVVANKAIVEAQLRACVQDLVAWVNTVLPPSEYDVRINHQLRPGHGLVFHVRVDPITSS